MQSTATDLVTDRITGVFQNSRKHACKSLINSKNVGMCVLKQADKCSRIVRIWWIHTI